MGSDDDDDSTGKSKIGDSRAKFQILLKAFVIGLCIGVVISERLYIKANKGVPVPVALNLRTERVEKKSALVEKLEKVAPDKEVFLAVSDKALLWDQMLGTFLQGVKQANITNHLIICLDKQTVAYVEERDMNAFLLNISVYKAQGDTGGNHAVSALKFAIIKPFLAAGWSVLLSDVDIAVLQNPFKFLYRDSDVEGMSDGYDERLAYGMIDGFDDPSMGWARYAQFYKHFNLNSGLFYLRSNNRTLNLVSRLEDRLSKTKYWDQTAWNEEIFFLSHDNYKSPQVTVRVLSIFKFMNSKVLFKDVRHRPKEQRMEMPVMVHINYHPDKHARMKAVFKYYLEHDEEALKPFPGGSEPGS